ncbi:6-phosphogluconolactonase [Synechococcales cyanobacterium C]|uniref:6-phosphogluconolactonase n=1 Tax=Petrachloros mirabilis ULC683 TaxID=2781853 RepID=A0A8K2A6Z2_9CYAN|nr:6-phosphogluconolactonase [Petrachloros mirabilis]NCJ05590.1 6-phosphogluconolactonase [Petrachloros mirabilis ULC683]
MNRTVEVLPSGAAVTERALILVLNHIEAAIADHDQFRFVLAGGSTPKALYEQLAHQDLPWSKIQVFWGDERYVPHTDPQSNMGMATQAWLSHVPIPAENLHPMPTHATDPAQAALAYEQHLRDFFGCPPGEFPAFDLILLGLGDDGHTASLFPETAALEVCDRLITVGEKSGQPRLTFTIPLINQAHAVLLLVTGENKQSALDQIFAETGNPRAYPARFIHPQGSLTWLLDAAAGQKLPMPEKL